MSECICSSCRNLKAVLDENGAAGAFECSFGFPSDECDECDAEGCDLSCSNYDSDEETSTRTVRCKGCGKEMEQVFDDSDAGEVYCISCYLSREDME